MPPQEEIQQPGQPSVDLGSAKSLGVSAVALSMLEQLTQSLGQISHNPIVAGAVFGRLGRAIQDHLIKNLKESRSLTDAQTLALNNFSRHTSRWQQTWASLGTGAASFGLKISQSAVELRKLGLELERYSTRYSGFGGTRSPLQAASYMRDRRQDAMGEFTTEYAMSEEEMRKWLHQKMPKGTPIDNEEAIVRRLSTYQEGLQLRALRPMLEHFFNNQATYGMDVNDTTRLVEQLMTGFNENKFGQLHPDEIITTFQSMFMKLVDSGIAPLLARDQALTTLETVGGAYRSEIDPVTNKPRHLPWGTEETLGVTDFITKIQGGQAGWVYEKFLQKNVPTGGDAPVQIIKDLREYIAKYMGETPDALFDLLKTEKGQQAWAQIYNLGESQFGLDKKEIALIMKSILPESQMTLAQNLTTETSKSILEVNAATKVYIEHLQKQIASTRRFGDAWNQLMDEGQQFLGENAPEALVALDIASGLLGIIASVGTYAIGWKMLMGKMGAMPLKPVGGVAAPTGSLFVDKNLRPIPLSSTSRGGKVPVRGGIGAGTWAASGFGAAIAGGVETYNSLERGEGTGEALGRGALTTGTTLGGSIGGSIGGTLLGAKIGGKFGSVLGPLGMLGGGAIGAIVGTLLGDVLFGSKKDSDTVASEQSDIPKIRVVITDGKDQKLADKVVATDGTDMIRVFMGGVLQA